jgi:hypothetical protein
MSFIHKYILDTYKNLPIHNSNLTYVSSILLRILAYRWISYSKNVNPAREPDWVGFGGSSDDSASINGLVLRLSHLN